MSATPCVPPLQLSGSVVSEPVGKGTGKMSARGELAWGAPRVLPPSDRFMNIFFSLTIIASPALWMSVERHQCCPSFISTSGPLGLELFCSNGHFPWATGKSRVREG